MSVTLNKDGSPRKNGLPQAQRDEVLARWVDGVPQRLIAQSLGLSENRVQFIVEFARKQGDPRAVRRQRYTRRHRLSAAEIAEETRRIVETQLPRGW